ncbi:hypothetical protein [Tropicibacter naphthalenivorans]|uniref:Uncharacterized protein n=1 Tax=Tropicibacter naphthalenivorans TaxID=441103 RepID=A0A0P1GHG0_9RHOB|nr:hypothetical protein [Tropicibacter naphthalenivorans]CUH81414.1 hypothetical protein TRN7648_03456 [Tropicibacter naphthalenivorans]SMD00528.1 hypothetical protein SAMN04488093_109134 [Tropicibacter naphthalenivorans]
MNRPFFQLAAILAFVFLGPALAADPVIVQTRGGAQGQGWLFGASGDSACWLALPEHVARGHEAAGVTFTTITGRSGETGPVIPVASNDEALAATGGQADLAFAPVKSTAITCLSSIGLPDYTYQAQLARNPVLQLTDHLSTSRRPFDVAIRLIRVDDVGGRVIALWPLRAEDEGNMSKGISGAVATLARAEGIAPFAMVFRVREDKQIAISLRFDAIRAAFGRIRTQWQRDARAEQISEDGLGYEIAGFEGFPLSGSSGPGSLRTPEGCWQAAAKGGAQTVDLVIETRSRFDHVEAIALEAGPECAPAPAMAYVEYRRDPLDSWTYHGTCAVRTADAPETPSCALDKSGRIQLRLRFPTDHGAVALSHLRLVGGAASE